MTMAMRTAPEAHSFWLPEQFRRFLRRRSVELGGLALFIVAGLLAAALASYTSSDPSFNTASVGAANNVVGMPGAYAADLILQTIGAAGIGLTAMFAAWGWALASHRGLKRLWLRALFAVAALIFAAAGFGALPAPGSWPIAAGLGGVAGELLAINLVAMSAVISTNAVAAAALTLALASFIGALGLTWREWRGIVRGGHAVEIGRAHV